MQRRTLALVVCSVLLAVGCTGGSEPSRQGPPPGAGGTLVGLMTQTEGSPYSSGALDPQVTSDTATLELSRCCLFRTLLSYDGEPVNEGGATPQPDLATGPPIVSADGLTWTFTLKTGIRYAPPLQDAQVQSGDFVRSIERALSPASPAVAKAYGCTPGPTCLLGSYLSQYLVPAIEGADAYAAGHAETISGLEAPSPDTLQIRLTQPSGDIAYLFALSATAPIPPKPGEPTARFGIAQGHDLDFGRGFAVGTGPYMVDGSDQLDFSQPPAQQHAPAGAGSTKLTLVRDPSWDPGTDDLRVGYAEQIVVEGVKDGNGDGNAVPEGERMILDGTGDLILDWPASQGMVGRYEASPTLRSDLLVYRQDALTSMFLNVAVPPLDDLHVRKAINLAIDKRALQRYLFTTSHVSTHIAPDGMEGDLLLNYAPYGDGSGDLEAARKEMASSPYDRNHDGVCDAPACRSVELATPASDFTGRVEMGPVIARQLAPLGIHVDVRANDNEWLSAKTDPAAAVAMSLFVFAKDYPSATSFFRSFSSSNLRVGAEIDPSLLGATSRQLAAWGYPVHQVPNVDDRVKACTRELFAEQVTCWKDFDIYLMQEVIPWVPLLAWTGATAFSRRVTGFSLDPSTPFPSPALDRITLTQHASPSGA
jgi:peptide/nickel transport system substrate-binding protein